MLLIRISNIIGKFWGKSIKWDYACMHACQIASVMSDSVQPHVRQPHQVPLSTGFSRQEYWSGLPFPSPKWDYTTTKSLQSCPTLCDPMDCSLPGFSVHGILQARTLEWVAISFSNAWKWKVKVKLLSLVRLLATPWTAAYQAPPYMGFSGQQYWSGVPLPSPKVRL